MIRSTSPELLRGVDPIPSKHSRRALAHQGAFSPLDAAEQGNLERPEASEVVPGEDHHLVAILPLQLSSVAIDSGGFPSERGVRVYAVTEAAAKRAAKVHQGLKATPIGERNTLIAGVCLAIGRPLLTANVRHFKRVPGLEIVQAR